MRNVSRERYQGIKRILGVVLALGLILGVAGTPVVLHAEGQDGNQETVGRKVVVDPTGRSEGFAAILYDNTSGLPTSEANDVLQTKEGFLWIGSYSGLIRYDGKNFERMDSTTGIASVVCLYADSQDRLWVGMNDSGAVMLDGGKEVHFGKAEGLKSASVRSITEDTAGNVIIATTHGIAIVDKDLNLKSLDEPQINEEYVRELAADANGRIYGLTMNEAIFVLENGKLTGFYEGSKMGIPSIHAIFPDPKKPGYVYLGTKGTDVYYGKLEDGMKDAKVINISPLNYVNDIAMFQDQLWVCADNGIAIVEGGKCKKLEHVPMTHSVEKVITDYQGNLWFTSSRQGVMKIVPDQFMNLFERYDLESEVVNSTCYLEGQLYVGTDRGLIVVNQEKVVDRIPLKRAVTAFGQTMLAPDLIALFSGCRIRSIIRDSKDRLWFSTYGENSLIRYDHGEVVRFSMEDGLPSNRIRTVVERKDGSVLVACTGGVAVIDGNQVKEVYNEKSGISNVEVLTVAEGGNGEIVLGTDGDGIYVFHDKNMTHVGMDEGLQSGVVMRIKRDEKRKMFWVVTSNSIAYLTDDYQVTTIQKFPYPNNFDLIENSKGDIWVLSSNGIYVVKAEDLLKNEEISTSFYSMENGLSGVATSNSYSDVSPDGELFVACTSGVVQVNVEKTFENVDDVKMAVPFLEADGKMIFPDGNGTFTIPSSTKKLTIYGYAFVYTLLNPEVTYYLKGFDKQPMTVKNKDFNEVSYTNLHGGTYHFVIQLNDQSGNGVRELSVKIVKKKALYELVWFQMLCLFFLFGIIACFVIRYVRRKTKALLKKQEEDKLLIRQITEAFAMTIDMKDRYTKGHSTRVADYTAMLAKELGYDEETVEKYHNIALLHDIGKIGVPPEVLNKQGKLTDQEFGIIKSHSALGFEALRKIQIMPELAVGARSHHERPDGKGYPQGLAGDQIPRVAQIIAVADTFDAMYSDRPYRKRMNFDKAVSIIKEVAGTQLATDVVEAFLRLVEKGEFRDPNDTGGGSMEDINNIHKKQDKEAAEAEEAAKAAEREAAREKAKVEGEATQSTKKNEIKL